MANLTTPGRGVATRHLPTPRAGGDTRIRRGGWQAAIATAALVLAIAGAGSQVVAMVRERAAPPTSTEASLGGMTASVGRVTAIVPDHGQPAQGFQMPQQMMPGMPAHGEVQLNVPIALVNGTDETQTLQVKQGFVLRGGPKHVALRPKSTTLGRLGRLGPGSGVNTVLYFNVALPKGDGPPLYLEWNRGGETTRLRLPLDGAGGTDHHHEG